MLNEPGILYLCATPIGNLEDMTFRAVRILGEVNLIAAEDTRHTRKLLSHYQIHTPLVSYHEHNKAVRGPELIGRLKAGESIAVVSDAGMPGISDPGADLVKLAVAEGLTVTTIPGPCAALVGLVTSGLDASRFVFLGFLPKTAKKRRELLEQVTGCRETLVLYESPHHLRAALAELADALGDRPAVAARELTKKFEELLRGSLYSLQEYFNVNQPRGEFTLLVAGAGDEPPGIGPEDEAGPEVSLYQAVMDMVSRGVDKKDAIKQVAVQRGLTRRQVYQAVLADREAEG